MSKSRRDIEIVWYPSRININIDVSSLLRVSRMAFVGNFVAYLTRFSGALFVDSVSYVLPKQQSQGVCTRSSVRG